MAQFDKFTERARKVLQLAQEEAQRFNHNYIGTEHLLLGLVREGDGVAARVLNNMGVQLPKVRSAVEFIIGRGEGAVIGDIGLTPRAKKVLELAVDEGRRLNHHYIGTEHLLLGLVREGEGIAAGVLESLGVNLEKVRAQVMQVVNGLPDRTNEPTQQEQESAWPGAGRYSPRTVAVLTTARDEADRFNHAHIGTEHLLLALLLHPDGVARLVLDQLGAKVDVMRAEIEARVNRTASSPPGLRELTPRHRLALQTAALEARRLGDPKIGTHHLLLGLLIANEGIAAEVLSHHQVTIDETRRLVREFAQLADPGELAKGDPTAAPAIGNLSSRTFALLSRALDVAQFHQHGQIGIGHILIALLLEKGTPVAQALEPVSPRHAELESKIIELISARTKGNMHERPLSRNVHMVLRTAHYQRALYSHYLVTPEHVLLGITIEGMRHKDEFQNELGIDLQSLQERIRQILWLPPDGPGSVGALVHR